MVWRAIGQGSPAVDRVIEANWGLAALGPLLPEGTPVLIPSETPNVADVELVQLWS